MLAGLFYAEFYVCQHLFSVLVKLAILLILTKRLILNYKILSSSATYSVLLAARCVY